VGYAAGTVSHVVYTNILEPLLRFVLVFPRRMLLPLRLVELAGRRADLRVTDTGKDRHVRGCARARGQVPVRMT